MFFLKNLIKLGGSKAAQKFQDDEKPFLEHLEDLRGTLMKILITVIVSTLLAFVFNKQLIDLIQGPLTAAGIKTVGSSFGPVEGFMGVLKICLYAGLIASFPLLLFFIGEFVIPGLTDKEKKLVLPVIIASFILFAAGVLFAYFVVIPRALEFFMQFGEERGIIMDLRFKYAVSFVTMMCIVFGLCFELPVVVMTLVKLDLLNSTMMRNTRSYAIVAMFIVSAAVTPTPDIFTMSLLAGPMIILYEICIWLAWGMERKAARREKEEKEREHQAMVERKKRAKQRIEAEEAERAKSGGGTPTAATGTLPYDPDNEASFDEDDDDHEGTSDSDEPDYHSGLSDDDEHASSTDDHDDHDEGDDSDAVWDRPPSTSTALGHVDSDHVEDPYSDPAHDGYDHDHYDHDYHEHDHHHHGDYYSGPTEELKRMLRDELKADLKELIKVELREEILAEIREELRRDGKL